MKITYSFASFNGAAVEVWIDINIHTIFCNRRNYSPMLVFMLTHVCKRGFWWSDHRNTVSAASSIFMNFRNHMTISNRSCHLISNTIHTRDPWSWSHRGPLARYVNYGLRMHRECRERFPHHRGLAIPTGITARAWRTCHDPYRDR